MSKNYVVFRTSEEIYVLEGTTGLLKWRVPFRENIYPASPVVENGVVIVSGSRGTSAYDLNNGIRLWWSQEDGGGPYVYPADTDQNIVVIIGDYISVHELHTGNLLWRVSIPGRSTALAFIDTDKLYTVFDGGIRGYNLQTGDLLWSNNDEGWWPRGVFGDGVLYLGYKDGIGAFDVKRQEILWLNPDIKLARSSLTVTKGLLLAGTESLTALDLNNGQVIWEAKQMPRAHYKKPCVVGDVIYIRDLFLDRLYTLKLQDGSVEGYLQLGWMNLLVENDQFSVGPVAYEEKSIIFPSGKTLYAYGE